MNWTRTFTPTHRQRSAHRLYPHRTSTKAFRSTGAACSARTATRSSASPAVSPSPVSALLRSAAAYRHRRRRRPSAATVDNKIHVQRQPDLAEGSHFLALAARRSATGRTATTPATTARSALHLSTAPTPASPYGDFLLNDLVAKGRGAVVGKWGHRHWRDASSSRTTGRSRRNFTLNLGMRWEYTQPIYEVADRQVNITPTPAQLLLCRKNGNSRALYNPYYKAFEPRVGFAWNPTPEVRRPRGLRDLDLPRRHRREPAAAAESAVLLRSQRQLRHPDARAISASASPTRRPPARSTDPRTGANPFYQGRAWDINLRPQFTQQFNVTTEYQFTNSTSLTVAYVGQLGTHLVDPHECQQSAAGRRAGGQLGSGNDRRPLAIALPNVGNIALTESAAHA